MLFILNKTLCILCMGKGYTGRVKQLYKWCPQIKKNLLQFQSSLSKLPQTRQLTLTNVVMCATTSGFASASSFRWEAGFYPFFVLENKTCSLFLLQSWYITSLEYEGNPLLYSSMAVEELGSGKGLSDHFSTNIGNKFVTCVIFKYWRQICHMCYFTSFRLQPWRWISTWGSSRRGRSGWRRS